MTSPIRLLTHARTAVLLASCLLAFPIASRAEMTNVLELIPANAQVVAVANNLQHTQTQLTSFAQRMNLPEQDAAGTLLGALGLTEGVDRTRPVVLILTDVSTSLEDPSHQPTRLALLPVADYQAFLGNLLNARTSGGITQGGAADRIYYVRQEGSYAVVSQERALVELYQPGGVRDAMSGQMGRVGGEYFHQSDLAIYADMQVLGPGLLKQIEQSMVDWQQQMQLLEELGMLEGSSYQSMQMAMGFYSAMFRQVIAESQGLVMAVQLDRDGTPRMRLAINAREDARLLEMLPQAHVGASRMLGMLSAQEYVMAMAIDASGLNAPALARGIVGQLGDQIGQWQESMELAMTILPEIQGYATAIYAADPLAMLGGSLINSVQVLMVNNAAEMRGQIQRYIESLDGQSMSAGTPLADERITLSSAYVPGAVQIQGLTLDQYEVRVSLPTSLLEQMGPMALMMQGLTQFRGYVAADGDRLLTTSFVDPALTGRALAAMREGGHLGVHGSIAGVREQVAVPHAFMEGFFNAGALLRAANPFMVMFGMPALHVADDLPPLAMAVGRDENAIAVQVVFPEPTIAFLVKLMQTFDAPPQDDNATPAPRGSSPRAPG